MSAGPVQLECAKHFVDLLRTRSYPGGCFGGLGRMALRGYPVMISRFFLYLKGGDGLEESGRNRLSMR
jgi:hypothetical protein